ncbi:MAG: hypothetical protein WDM88_07320 [Galbitalea sp.]
MFATPSGRAFYAGTFFAHADAGVARFRELLEAMVDAWTDRRADVEDAAARLARLSPRRRRWDTRANRPRDRPGNRRGSPPPHRFPPRRILPRSSGSCSSTRTSSSAASAARPSFRSLP